MKSALKLPNLITCDDYHEFPDVQDMLRHLTGSNAIKVKEVCFNGNYVGVVYIGAKPDRAVIARLAKAQSVELFYPDDNEE